MRLLLIWISLTFLASCTLTGSQSSSLSSGEGNPSSQTSNKNLVPSVISPTDKYDIALQKTIASPSTGSGAKNITIYADFQCPACINFAGGLEKVFLQYADTGKTTITYRQFPLTGIHKNAYRDAIAGLCSAEQGKYMEAKSALYALEDKKRGARVTDTERIDVLTQVGLDKNSLTQCLADNRYARQIDEEVREGDALGVNGTPTVLLDGKRLDLGVIFADPVKGQAFLDNIFGK